MKTRIILMSTFLVASFAFFAFSVPQDQKKPAPWKIDAKYKAMKNPSAGDAESVKLGKALYAKHCKSCHGNLGLGDGPKAANMETFPGNFSDAKFQSAYADGELLYMILEGRDEMPKFDGKIPDEEGRWAVVNYVRSLKK
ncbi:MAG: c-type cytochrome [Bacteroidales bacterium]